MALRTVSILGGNWNAVTTWVGGVVPLANDTVDFTALSGNLTVNVTTAALAGINFTNYVGIITFNSNIVLNTSVNLGSGGYTQAGTFGLSINNITTITSNGVALKNLTTTPAITITLTDILVVYGTLSIAGSSFATSACHVKGNLTITGNTGTGGTIIINGTGNQIWSGVNRLRTDLQINKPSGTLTVSGSVAFTNSILTYIAGNVDTTGSTLTIDVVSTLDTNDLVWNNISLIGGIQTLLSDLNCQNLTSGGNTINGLFNVNVSGNLTASGITLIGTATIVLTGTGLWTATNAANTFRAPIIINTNGIITLANSLTHDGDLTYIKGIVKSNNTTINFGSSLKTLINLHKLIFKNVILGSSVNFTMNEFFSGSPSLVTNISSSTTTNYTIAFQDGFEKISKFVNINNCTLSKPLQLLVITNSSKSSNNRGIRYINQSPNGIAKNKPSVNVPMAYGVGGLINDPNM
jgi:hypothetical protein